MKKFKQALATYIDSKRIIDNPLLCYAYGTDASLYRLIPKLVVLVKTNDEVRAVIKLANKYDVKITFRAAGTSLSGQALTDQVLVVLSNTSWQKYSINSDGSKITLEPGIIGAHANIYLKPYNTKIGPDPASINSCKIGGIAANNSSGMCCGISKNSYQTMSRIKLILANSASLDTGDYSSINRFKSENSHIIEEIISIRDEIKSDSMLYDLIKHKFKIKNTSGYSLNSFIDFSDPIDILSHLMIGSEGTLGFISEISYNCVPDHQFKAVSLIYCNDLRGLIDITLKFRNVSIDAIELLDITSLHSIKDLPIAQPYLPQLGIDTAAMLVEVSGLNQIDLEEKISALQNIIDQSSILSQIKFTTDENIYHDLWAIRKGILPTIGGSRPSGSSCIIEDIAVDIHKLPQLVDDLRELFIKYNYNNAAIFGHILAGNIHFVFTPSFDDEESLSQYKNFMDSMCNLVATKYQGSLKAEHGCGRNIAPFVELEWGSKAYSLMWRIKKLLDPKLILNPDVKLTNNPHLHLENLKEINTADPEIDKCIECGFCEVVCPSKNLTLTPRQRITTYRKMQKLKSSDPKMYKQFLHDYKYYAIDTCATTGLCKTSCPVGINTGSFILSLREKSNSSQFKNSHEHFDRFINYSKIKLNIGNLTADTLGRYPTYRLSKRINEIIPIIPIYLPTLPESQTAKFIDLHEEKDKPKIMYFPTCNNRIMGDTTQKNTENALQQLIKALGYTITYPTDLNNLCCGQVFSSKGNKESAGYKEDELVNALSLIDYPIIMDNSSCLYSILQKNKIKVIDSTNFIYTHLDKLKLTPKYSKLALHIDCSSKKLGYENQIRDILSKCATKIITPVNISCCGFAGDKGLITPELNQTALNGLKHQIEDCDIGVTFNRNCQIGLSFYGAKTYLSLPEIVLHCITNHAGK